MSDLPLPDGVAGYAVDVEDMEELARSLRAFREAQRSMLDQLSAGVAQFDARRQLTFANQPFARIFNLSPGAGGDQRRGRMSGSNVCSTARVKRDACQSFAIFPPGGASARPGSPPRGAQEEAWPLPDGTHLRVVAQPTPDGGLLLIVEDRTEQLRISAMRDTLLRTRTAIFDSLFEAVAVFAPDGRMQLWNRRFASAWGLNSAFLDTHPHVTQLLERIASRLARPAQSRSVGDTVRAATLERQARAGRVALADGRTLEFAGVPLPDGNGLLTVLDITDSQRAEDALRERNAALVEASAVKTRFLATMSYEFRTPLTSIGGFAELLQAGVGGELTAAAQEYVSAILTSVARLGEQIENVLDLSQSEAGLLPLAREKLELMPFVTRLVEDRAARIQTAGLTLDLKGSKAAGAIAADPRRLARAIGHLIDNAIAATPRGGRILVDIARRRGKAGAGAGAGKSADRVRIVISDNGAGMDAASLARVLDGLKLSVDGKAVELRQGLGLPLARQLVEAHGGTLEMLSEPGAGTSAIVDLPGDPVANPG